MGRKLVDFLVVVFLMRKDRMKEQPLKTWRKGMGSSIVKVLVVEKNTEHPRESWP